MLSIPTVTLNDGIPFPELGLGTYGLRGDDGVAAVIAAIDSGYRLLDTAVNYENEREVGEAVRDERRRPVRAVRDDEDPRAPSRLRRRDREHERIARA